MLLLLELHTVKTVIAWYTSQAADCLTEVYQEIGLVEAIVVVLVGISTLISLNSSPPPHICL